MTNEKRQTIFDKIRSNIDSHGYHVRIVDGGPSPRFAYTIGLHSKFGFELVFAGGFFFTPSEMLGVVNAIARRLQAGESFENSSLSVDRSGSFLLSEAESSWISKMLLGALDYLKLEQIRALQITPDRNHWTIDIPDMQEPWNPSVQPIWQWLERAWAYPVSSKSKAITNLDALRGHPVTEVSRWEEDEWEMFAGAGPDVEKADIRTVPLGTMIAIDETVRSAFDLEVGSGIWRDDEGGEWQAWGKQEWV